ncbi:MULTISPECIES: alpha/beta hydrolase [unclassified Herbaspirillum]|uniref:alpha/beta fold hydrolase n=1 Tax=unclassified Herbaspirillum TaxID=2624150 RepID=UPI000E2F0462|nr:MULTISPECIES: alpha/beta hydrolase [unclassified Herbaspirillum]RFB68110.1 alpha/beta hydrolase [Herbaspirillum sp. 3R-3a1]TFI06555.1 alpha/beta hydrolase [Herbaspirillum sp. 3R11]TFI13833.1 alpha/beta hydrolase [Herbaspirillum sp. 3R-11]TFI29277.1 alpha/beta hydrolase [Herbaspirillum sp. 3C11]
MRDLVFLPGFMLNASLWDDMRSDLATLGTLHFGDLGQDNSLDAMADRVLANAPDKFVLFGFSMGGFVAQAIALKAPERVLGLGLLNTSSRPQSEQESAATLAQIALAEKAPFKGLTSRALASSLHPDRAGDAALLQRLQAMALNNGKEVFLRQLSTLRDGSYADLHRIDCPALIVASDADRLRTVEESEEMAQRIPAAHFEIVRDCGHMTPMEKPQELFTIIRDWIAASGL